MKECPVCRAPLFGNPSQCEICETPLSGRTISTTPWAFVFTFLCPGLGHLWRGHWLPGLIAGFFSLVFALVGYGVLTTQTGALVPYLILGGSWLVWVGFWIWEIRPRRRKFVSFSSVTSIVIGLLLLINLSLFINIVMLTLERT